MATVCQRRRSAGGRGRRVTLSLSGVPSGRDPDAAETCRRDHPPRGIGSAGTGRSAVIVTRTGWNVWIFGVRLEQFVWGILGASAALLFAIWMLFFPGQVPGLFAWDVHPRLAMAFIGAGYIFRTAFFLSVAFQPNWLRLRWLFWGNLAFTGTLLLATYWHAEEFHWDPSRTIWAHVWLILYVYEPVTMLYMIPRAVRAIPAPTTGGPILRLFRVFLIALAGPSGWRRWHSPTTGTRSGCRRPCSCLTGSLS